MNKPKVFKIILVIFVLGLISSLAIIKDKNSNLRSEAEQFANDLRVTRLVEMAWQQHYRLEINPYGYRVVDAAGKQVFNLADGSKIETHFQTGKLIAPIKYLMFTKKGLALKAESLLDKNGRLLNSDIIFNFVSIDGHSSLRIIISGKNGYALIE